MTWTRLLCWSPNASVTTETPTKWSPSWRAAIFGLTPNCGTKSGQYRSTLIVSITESHSDLDFSGSADLGEDGEGNPLRQEKGRADGLTCSERAGAFLSFGWGQWAGCSRSSHCPHV